MTSSLDRLELVDALRQGARPGTPGFLAAVHLITEYDEGNLLEERNPLRGYLSTVGGRTTIDLERLHADLASGADQWAGEGGGTRAALALACCLAGRPMGHLGELLGAFDHRNTLVVLRAFYTAGNSGVGPPPGWPPPLTVFEAMFPDLPIFDAVRADTVTPEVGP